MKEISTEGFGYDTLSALHGIIDKESHRFIHLSNDETFKVLGGEWTRNIKTNFKRGLLDTHGCFITSCSLMGVNKAVIGVGAGPSLEKNQDVLKLIHDVDGVKDWEDRNFIILASNHQYKPLLKMGITPDFVVLADASDVVYTQLCVDIPNNNCSTLIAPFHGSPKVFKEWSKQGRGIEFYSSPSKNMAPIFEKVTKKKSKMYAITGGGNVLNTMWMFGSRVFGSKAFICLGNDLSFPIKEKKEDQEKGYYADGDYSSNAKGTGTGRDEAACEKKWLSFAVQERKIEVPGKNKLEIIGGDIVGTSHTLWVYKTWQEEAMLLASQFSKAVGLHYYNCTEGGILGVMARSLDDDEMKKDENWYMLDDVCPRWHTTTFEHAATQFLMAKEKLRLQNSGILSP